MTLVPMHPRAQPKRPSILFCPIYRANTRGSTRRVAAWEHGAAAASGAVPPMSGQRPRAASGGRRRVSPESNVQDHCCLHADDGEPVLLAERVSLGHRATVHGAQVETGALIGIGATVLGRARVGAGALVAAGTVVLPGTTVPAGVLFAGVPGRVVRELSDADRAVFADTPAHYVGQAARHRAASWRDFPGA